MSDSIEKICEALIPPIGVLIVPEELKFTNVPDSYRRFFALCNGGYSEDWFFHFFGSSGPREHSLYEWNRTDLWKHYFSLDEMAMIFAENVFGTQFYFDVRGNRKVVKMLSPESGRTDLCANSFEDFLEGEVFGFEFNSEARKLAKRFFETNQTREFTHISQKIPTLLGGRANDLDNLELADSLLNLTLLGQIVAQVRHLPSGTRIGHVRVDGGPKM